MWIHLFVKYKTNNIAAAKHPDNGLNCHDSSAGPGQDLSFSLEEVTGQAAANIGYYVTGLVLNNKDS